MEQTDDSVMRPRSFGERNKTAQLQLLLLLHSPTTITSGKCQEVTYVRLLGILLHQSHHFEDVEESIVVGFDCERRLTTVLRHPAKAHHCLQRQVLVAVDEVALNQVAVPRKLRIHRSL